MSSGLLKNVFLSIGAFSVGVAFERQWKLHADIGKNDQLIVSPSSDVVDGPFNSKPLAEHNKLPLLAKHGYPSFDSLRYYKNFIVSYDRRNRIANWVLEYVTKEDLASDSYDRSGIDFYEDKSFHNFFRSTNQDYFKSGYDRGHLAAAGNYRSNRDHIQETFVLSNIAPQVGNGFNRDKWNDVEKYARKVIKKSGHAWICTGPLYLPKRDPSTGKLHVKYEVIGKNHVSVPTHFFKVILHESPADGRTHLECFLLPNEPIDVKRDIKEFRIDPEFVERAAGFLFFNQLPRKNIRINQ